MSSFFAVFGSEDYTPEMTLENGEPDDAPQAQVQVAQTDLLSSNDEFDKGSDLIVAMEQLRQSVSMYGSESLDSKAIQLVNSAAMMGVSGVGINYKCLIPTGESYTGVMGSEAIGEKIKTVFQNIGQTLSKAASKAANLIGKLVFWIRGFYGKIKKVESLLNESKKETATFNFKSKNYESLKTSKELLKFFDEQTSTASSVADVANVASGTVIEYSRKYLLGKANAEKRGTIVVDLFKDFKSVVDKVKTAGKLKDRPSNGFRYVSPLNSNGCFLGLRYTDTTITDEDSVMQYLKAFSSGAIITSDKMVVEEHEYTVTKKEIKDAMTTLRSRAEKVTSDFKTIEGNLSSILRSIDEFIKNNVGGVAGFAYTVVSEMISAFNVGMRLSKEGIALVTNSANYAADCFNVESLLWFARTAAVEMKKE